MAGGGQGARGERTCDGSADLSGGRFSHFQGRLLTVPGSVGGADQVGCILQRALGKALVKKMTSLLICSSIPTFLFLVVGVQSLSRMLWVHTMGYLKSPKPYVFFNLRGSLHRHEEDMQTPLALKGRSQTYIP